MDGPLHAAGEPKWHKWNGSSCLPGEEVDVSVTLTAPTRPGTYEAFWRLCCSSPQRGFKKFGQRLRLYAVVTNRLGAQSELPQESELGAAWTTQGAQASSQGTFCESGQHTEGKGAWKGKGKGKGKGCHTWKGKGAKGYEAPPRPCSDSLGCKKLMARFVRDVTISPSDTVVGGTQFTKTWRVRNDSGYPWPPSVLVLFVGGDAMDSTGDDLSVKTQRPVLSQDTCLPGEEVDVSIQLTAPTKSGAYEGFWRLCANFPDRGFKKFGMRLRVKVNVCEERVNAEPVHEGSDFVHL